MEIIKKSIFQIVTTGKTSGGDTIIIPDLTKIYHMKFGLVSEDKDIGFFDAYIAPITTGNVFTGTAYVEII